MALYLTYSKRHSFFWGSLVGEEASLSQIGGY